MRRFVVRVAFVSVFAAACGPGDCCGSAEVANYEKAHGKAIEHEVDAHEYKRPIAEAWPEILQVLSEHGYPLAQKTPVEGQTLESSYNRDYRVLLHVIRIDASRWRLRIDKQYRSVDSDGGISYVIEKRNADREMVDMMWAILERVEPTRASEIQGRAKTKAERAGAVGRGCDKGCATCGSMVPDPPPAK